MDKKSSETKHYFANFKEKYKKRNPTFGEFLKEYREFMSPYRSTLTEGPESFIVCIADDWLGTTHKKIVENKFDKLQLASKPYWGSSGSDYKGEFDEYDVNGVIMLDEKDMWVLLTKRPFPGKTREIPKSEMDLWVALELDRNLNK